MLADWLAAILSGETELALGTIRVNEKEKKMNVLVRVYYFVDHSLISL